MRKYSLIIILLSFLPGHNLVCQTLNWANSFGGNGNTEWANDILYHQGNITICGVSNSTSGDFSSDSGEEMWIMVCDTAGNIESVFNFGGTANEGGKSIASTSDGGYAVVGIGFSTDGDAAGANYQGNGDFWVVKLDANFNIEWQEMYGGSNRDDPQKIIQTSDGNFIIAGNTTSSDGDVTGFHIGSPIWNDAWILKIDPQGTIIWQKCIGGSEDEAAWSIIESPSAYLFAGHSQSTDGDITSNYGNRDLLVASLSKSSGSINWLKTYGGSEMDTGLDLIYTERNTIAVTGHANSDDIDVLNINGMGEFWYLDLDTSGNILTSTTYGSPGSDVANEIEEVNANRYLLCGRAATGGSAGGDASTIYGNTDAWVITVDSIGNLLAENNFGGSNNDIFYGGVLTDQGILFAVGQTTSDDFDLSQNMGGNDWFAASISYEDLMITSVYRPGHEVELFKAFPNPTSENLNIKTNTETGHIDYFRLYDLNGSYIQNVNIGTNRLRLPNGMYLLIGYRDSEVLQIEKVVLLD